jgi:hypothetical protein
LRLMDCFASARNDRNASAIKSLSRSANQTIF